MLGGGRIKDTDDLVLHEGEPFGAAPSVTVLQQHGLRGGARRDHLRLEELRHRRAEHVLAAGMFFGECIDRGGDPRGFETIVGVGAGRGHEAIHALSGYRTAPALSRDL